MNQRGRSIFRELEASDGASAGRAAYEIDARDIPEDYKPREVFYDAIGEITQRVDARFFAGHCVTPKNATRLSMTR